MRGTNVNTTPQPTIQQIERQHGGRSTQAQAGGKGQQQYNT